MLGKLRLFVLHRLQGGWLFGSYAQLSFCGVMTILEYHFTSINAFSSDDLPSVGIFAT